jgi:DNA gyrase/topoisomerase IV subunit B
MTFLLDHRAFRAPDGLTDHARYLARSDRPLHAAPLRLRGAHGGVAVDVALLWTDRAQPRIKGLVDYARITGTHLRGLHEGLRGGFEAAAPERFRGVYAPAFREAVTQGLIAVVAVDLDDTIYRSPHGPLTSPEARTAVAAVVTSELADTLAQQPDLLARLLARMPG